MMKAAEQFKKGGAKLDGVILNSRGNRNADAWGKRAEWVDFSGPDASGETVGIAMVRSSGQSALPDALARADLRLGLRLHGDSETGGLKRKFLFGLHRFDQPSVDHQSPDDSGASVWIALQVLPFHLAWASIPSLMLS